MKKNENENIKEKKIPTINIPKPKKKKIKSSYKVVHKNESKGSDNDIKENKFDKEILSDRIEVKRNEKSENNSGNKEDNKEKVKKKISADIRTKSNEYKAI